MDRPSLMMLVFVSAAALPVMQSFNASHAADTFNASALHPAGARIYQKLCASCHGKSGQGVKGEYSKSLVGDKSVPQLIGFIVKSMPDETPKKCVGPDAEKVARYIYDAFYSPIAAARNRPPRIQISHLSVRQYRNAVADLIGTFGSETQLDQQRGLKGEYFKSRALNRNRIISRTDPQVRFDLGPKFTDRNKFDPKGFSIRWTGSLLAPTTGKYDMVIRTDQSMKFWLNDPEKPLIDAYVRSGDKTEHRASIFLIGGRAYPLSLEFSSYRQGVGDSDKRKGKIKPVPAFIELHWKLPEGIDQLIPARNLSPRRTQKTFVVTAPFPPDDRSAGYEQGTSASRAWDEATTAAAIETAAYVIQHLDKLAGSKKQDPDRTKFCRRFLERAFRRPTNDQQRKLYIDRQFAEAPNMETAVKRVVILALKSPRFLYLDMANTKPDAYDMASRLSFALWDSLPDARLSKAAAAGQLTTPKQLVDQAERMLQNPRARAKMRQFLYRWLDIEHVSELEKDGKQFPGFDPYFASDLRTSLDLFIDDVVWGEQSDFRNLLISNELFLNGRLAKYYGLKLPDDAPFQKVSGLKAKRAGIITHPYLLARFAYADASSPIHRGVFLVRSILGRTLRPPPIAVAPSAVDLNPNMTTRQRVSLQTKAKSCQSCHSMINSLGFTLENFDAVGRYRDKEKNKPIDATGFYILEDGKKKVFANAGELSRFLASSPQTHLAFVKQAFHHMVKQPIYAYGLHTPNRLRQNFADHKFNIRKLMVNIAVTAATGKQVERRKTASGAKSQ